MDIRKWEYGNGPLFGYKDYKDYINDIQDCKCLLCGKNPIQYYHHIKKRSDGGSNKISNLVGLCWDCHYGPKGVHNCQETEDKLMVMKSTMNSQYKVSLLNSVMPVLIKEIKSYCTKNHLTFTITNGKETYAKRTALNLPKTHAIDGYCISRKELKNSKFMPDRIYLQQRYKKKSNNNINALNKREYYLNNKLVAVNRHKATDQKADSLEEFLIVYRKTHTEKEVQQMMHQIVIKPARRTYTYKRKFANKYKINQHEMRFHSGDTILYKKHNKTKGNTKTQIFVCTDVRMSNNKVSYGTKNKLMKFCKVIKSGCTPFMNYTIF